MSDVLGVVGVLVLVDEHVLEELLIVRTHGLVVAQELAGFKQQIPEVQSPGRVELALVGQVDVRGDLARGLGRGHGVDGVGLGVEQVVLGARDDADVHAGLGVLPLQADA